MGKKVETRKMVRILNGKQPTIIKLVGGYLSLLPREEVLVAEESMTQDLYSKMKRRILQIENVSEAVSTVDVVEKDIKI